MRRDSRGFTLIELMIVVTIIGILASIAIPNYISMQDRAREGRVKANMHTLQTGVEDFAIINGRYPDGGAGDGGAVALLLSGTVIPENPFTGVASVVTWGGMAAAQGDLGYQVPGQNRYLITGFGASALLPLQLTNF